MSISSKISTPERVQYFYMGYGQKEAGPRDPQFWLKGFQWLGRFLKGKPVGHPGAGHLPEHLRPKGVHSWENKLFDYAFPGTVGATVVVKQKNELDKQEQFRYEHAVGRYESERDQAIAEGKAQAAEQGATYVQPSKWTRGQGREPSPPVYGMNWISSALSGFGAMTGVRRKHWRDLIWGKSGKPTPNLFQRAGGTIFPVAAYQSPHFQSMFSPTKDWIKQRVEDTTEGLQGMQAGAEIVQQSVEGWTPDLKKVVEEVLGTKARKEYNIRVRRHKELRADYENSDKGIAELAQYEEKLKEWKEHKENDWRHIPADAQGNKRRPPEPTLPGPVTPTLTPPSSLMDEFKVIARETKILATNAATLTENIAGDVAEGAVGLAGSADNINETTRSLWKILDRAEAAVEDGFDYIKDNKRAVIATGAAYMLAAGGIAGVIYWLKEVNKRRTLEEQDKRQALQQRRMMKMVLQAQKEDTDTK